ncbi:cytochrome P450 [Nitratireductor pacificus]|uniref:Cytochrome P450 n=1 Tax=Nitratireductor pacificus pht-3B TaxID=391937 RepID=K2MCW2_9HYPH|nr:cytochrome P450 [Nitratireductor pacificus]EKF20036.1 cytochrome P450 [Nitratireductor pacificus pht-3B]
METIPAPFVPPAPRPRTKPPSTLQMMRIVYRNPLELWGEPSYNEPWISIEGGIGGPLVIANDPGLIRHVLVDNARNYKMARVRQKILRPILRDGLLTAEGEVWRRSRKAMAPVFTPRHIAGFAVPMLARTEAFAGRYAEQAAPVDVSRDMTLLTFDILAETLFSDEIAGDPGNFAHQVDRLFETMGRVDPLDLLGAPDWLPRIMRLLGRNSLAFFRNIVSETMDMRRRRMEGDDDVPEDFLTLLLRAEGPDGLTRQEIEDNLITFIGAGHETTARALGWTIYCLAEAPWERERIEAEIDAVLAREPDPVKWLDAMPFTRAAFEEAMRLYPPAPSINREALAEDRYGDFTIRKGAQVLVMPWTVHRHRRLWENPEAFMPERFHPENRDRLDRYQYLPFGAGPRVCIGATFAMQEAVIALAVLLGRYRFDTLPETRPWPVQKLTTQPQGGLPMRVSRR